MTKTQAIRLLGGTVAAAAARLKVSYQAVNKWPTELPPRIEARVVAAIAYEKLDLPALLGAAPELAAQVQEASHA